MKVAVEAKPTAEALSLFASVANIFWVPKAPRFIPEVPFFKAFNSTSATVSSTTRVTDTSLTPNVYLKT